MKRFILCSITLSLIIQGCATSKLLVSERTPQEVNNITIIEPLTRTFCIHKGNNLEYDQKFSDSTRLNLMIGMRELIGPHLNSAIVKPEESETRQFYDELSAIILRIENQRSLKEIKLSPFLDSFLKKRHIEYGLVTISDGFTRTRGNFSKQLATGALITVGSALISPLIIDYNPVTASSNIRVIILDSERSSIAFYRRSFEKESEPIVKEETNRQLSDIFKGYFLKKQEW